MRTLLLLWTLPILIGALSAAAKITMYRMLAIGPGQAPGFAIWLIVLAVMIASVWTTWVLAARMRRRLRLTLGSINRPALQQINVLATWMTGLLTFCYVYVRSASVNSSLFMQLGYCCCCESLPEATETLVRVFNPFSF